jgi:hypothetical protein
MAGGGGALTLWAVLHPGFDERALLSALLALVLMELHGVHTATYASRYHPDQFKFARRLQANKDIANFLCQADLQAPVRISVLEEDIPLNFGDYHGIDAIGGYAAGIPENLLRAKLIRGGPRRSSRSRIIWASNRIIPARRPFMKGPPG